MGTKDARGEDKEADEESDDSADNKDSLVDWEDALRIEDEEEEELTGKTESVEFEDDDDEGSETVEIACRLSQQDCLLYLTLLNLFLAVAARDRYLFRVLCCCCLLPMISATRG